MRVDGVYQNHLAIVVHFFLSVHLTGGEGVGVEAWQEEVLTGEVGGRD